MSTTRSATTGRFAIGSTVTVPLPGRQRVTQASPSRPLTRIPQVPQEAWKQECRRRAIGSGAARIQEGVEHGGARRRPGPRAPRSGDRCRRGGSGRPAGCAPRSWDVPPAPGPAGSAGVTAGDRRRLISCGEVGGVGKEDDLAGAARGVDAELAADHVGGHASAIPRRVVALPPVMVTNPSTPSVRAWSMRLERPGQLTAPHPASSMAPIERPGRGPGGPDRRRRGHGRDQVGTLVGHRAGRDRRARPGRRGPPRPRSWCRRSTGPAGGRRCRRRRNGAGGSPPCCTGGPGRPRARPGRAGSGTSTPAIAARAARTRGRWR